MAWTTPRTWVTGEVVTASLMNTHVRDNFNETGAAKITGGSQLLVGTAANSLAARTFGTDAVTTGQTSTSTSYTDLATVGPEVTVTTGTQALVTFDVFTSNNTSGGRTFAALAISGATTASAATDLAAIYEASAASDAAVVGRTFLYTGLTAGSNTFTLKYQVSTGTGTWQYRRLTVMPL